MHNEAKEIREGERPHKKIRYFDKLAFHLYDGEAMSKAAAQASATYWKARNYLVRIVKEQNHNEWLIYRRKKTTRR